MNLDSTLCIVKNVSSLLTIYGNGDRIVTMNSTDTRNSINESMRTGLLNMVESLANRTLKDLHEHQETKSHLESQRGADTLLVVFTIENDPGLPVEKKPTVVIACAVHSSIICACSPVIRRLFSFQSAIESTSVFTLKVLDITSVVRPSLSYLLPLLLDNLMCVEGKRGADSKLLKSLRRLCINITARDKEQDSELSKNMDFMDYISSLESPWKHTTVSRWMVAAVGDLLTLAIVLQLGDFVGKFYGLFSKLLSVSTVLDILLISINRQDLQHEQMFTTHLSSFFDQLQEIAIKFLMSHWDIVLSAFPDFKAAVHNCVNSDSKASDITDEKPSRKFLHNSDFFSFKLEQEFIKQLVKRREEDVAKARKVQLDAEICQDMLLQLRLNAANLKQTGASDHVENEGRDFLNGATNIKHFLGYTF
jgi:hypothetical protein